LVSWIFARHHSLRRLHRAEVAKKWEVAKNWLFGTFAATVFVASWKRPVHS